MKNIILKITCISILLILFISGFSYAALDFKDPGFQSPNQRPRESGEIIKAVVLHYTQTNTLQEALNAFKEQFKGYYSPELKRQVSVSAHFLLDKNGDIYNVVSEDKVAFHAGVSSWKDLPLTGPDKNSIDGSSIGIEIVNNGNEPYTDIQYSSLKELINYLVDKYKITPDYIVGHSDVAPGRKTDPGDKFEWDKIPPNYHSKNSVSSTASTTAKPEDIHKQSFDISYNILYRIANEDYNNKNADINQVVLDLYNSYIENKPKLNNNPNDDALKKAKEIYDKQPDLPTEKYIMSTDQFIAFESSLNKQQGVVVTPNGKYDSPRKTKGIHYGYDFSFGADQKIYAAYSGSVDSIHKNWGGHGDAVWVKSTLPDGSIFIFSYGHINVASSLTPGTQVNKNDLVGTIFKYSQSHLDVKTFYLPIKSNWWNTAFPWSYNTQEIQKPKSSLMSAFIYAANAIDNAAKAKAYANVEQDVSKELADASKNTALASYFYAVYKGNNDAVKSQQAADAVSSSDINTIKNALKVASDTFDNSIPESISNTAGQNTNDIEDEDDPLATAGEQAGSGTQNPTNSQQNPSSINPNTGSINPGAQQPSKSPGEIKIIPSATPATNPVTVPQPITSSNPSSSLISPVSPSSYSYPSTPYVLPAGQTVCPAGYNPIPIGNLCCLVGQTLVGNLCQSTGITPYGSLNPYAGFPNYNGGSQYPFYGGYGAQNTLAPGTQNTVTYNDPQAIEKPRVKQPNAYMCDKISNINITGSVPDLVESNTQITLSGTVEKFSTTCDGIANQCRGTKVFQCQSYSDAFTIRNVPPNCPADFPKVVDVQGQTQTINWFGMLSLLGLMGGSNGASQIQVTDQARFSTPQCQALLAQLNGGQTPVYNNGINNPTLPGFIQPSQTGINQQQIGSGTPQQNPNQQQNTNPAKDVSSLQQKYGIQIVGSLTSEQVVGLDNVMTKMSQSYSDVLKKTVSVNILSGDAYVQEFKKYNGREPNKGTSAHDYGFLDLTYVETSTGGSAFVKGPEKGNVFIDVAVFTDIGPQDYMWVIAHEFGHLAEQDRKRDDIAQEKAADDFATNLLNYKSTLSEGKLVKTGNFFERNILTGMATAQELQQKYNVIIKGDTTPQKLDNVDIIFSIVKTKRSDVFEKLKTLILYSNQDEFLKNTKSSGETEGSTDIAEESLSADMSISPTAFQSDAEAVWVMAHEFGHIAFLIQTHNYNAGVEAETYSDNFATQLLGYDSPKITGNSPDVRSLPVYTSVQSSSQSNPSTQQNPIQPSQPVSQTPVVPVQNPSLLAQSSVLPLQTFISPLQQNPLLPLQNINGQNSLAFQQAAAACGFTFSSGNQQGLGTLALLMQSTQQQQACYIVCGKEYWTDITNACVAQPQCGADEKVIAQKDCAYGCKETDCGKFQNAQIDITVKNDKGTVVNTYETRTDSNGKYSYTFKTPNIEGQYAVIINVVKNWDSGLSPPLSPINQTSGSATTCIAPLTLVNGVCQCNPPYYINNGVCQSPSVTCVPPYVLSNGQCLCVYPHILSGVVCI